MNPGPAGVIPEVELAELTIEKRALQLRIKRLEEQIAYLEGEILPQWTEDQVTQLKVKTSAGPYTLYLSSQVWASTEFLDLEKLGDEFPGLLSLNRMTASAALREYLASDDKEALAQLAQAGVTPIEKTRINVKRSH